MQHKENSIARVRAGEQTMRIFPPFMANKATEGNAGVPFHDETSFNVKTSFYFDRIIHLSSLHFQRENVTFQLWLNLLKDSPLALTLFHCFYIFTFARVISNIYPSS